MSNVNSPILRAGALAISAFLCLAGPSLATEALPIAAPIACQANCSGKRPGDQVWVVCTRHLGCDGVTLSLPNYHVSYFAQGAWHGANADTFLSFDEAARPTIFFVHGNRYTQGEAIESGWEAYHALVRRAPEQRIRFVIWSWPSDKQGGPIQDARIKASRTLVEGYYLARLMTRMQPSVPTGVIGYSFGSRVALGAAHLAAGGQLAGRVVPDLASERAMYRIAMLAAGAEDDSLLPGARFQLAMSSTEHLLNLYNPADPILKRYHVVDKWEKPTAMGYTGIAGEYALGAAAQRITECNVSGLIGKTHDEELYFSSEQVMHRVRATVLPSPVVVVPAGLARQ